MLHHGLLRRRPAVRALLRPGTAGEVPAGVIGQCWAERICRGELRAEPAWPERGEKTIRIARRLVASLSKDPRLLDDLAAACSSGAAAWWQRRPARYRA
jgi:hypothetical protein